jgi:Kef-type K+ transport system membrane component KefB
VSDLSLLLAQMVVILATARVFGFLSRKIAQPLVVAEMVAGIVLGPSFLGAVAPGASALIFPSQSLGHLGALSQLGLVLFMFLVGLELDLTLVRRRGRTAIAVSQASIAIPFALGAALAVFLHPRLATAGTPVFVFAAFFGTAMSITAFPVLARILGERRLLRSDLGSVAMCCAAVDDLTGWLLMAAIVLYVRAPVGGLPLWMVLAGTVAYIFVMVWLVRPAVQRMGRRYEAAGIGEGVFASVLLLLLVSSWTTERLGLHAVFGAFLLGAILPRHDGLLKNLHERLNDLTVVVLLPLFFAFSGLRSSVRLLDSLEAWLCCAVVVAVAIAGKLGGSLFAARLTGMSWREASALGILMNTRGLMELVLLNIGLDLGVISQTVFTMLVVMALVTTFMTAPVLEWVYFGPTRRSVGAGRVPLRSEPRSAPVRRSGSPSLAPTRFVPSGAPLTASGPTSREVSLDDGRRDGRAE